MRKTDLNAIYISERVQETLRPVSVSALTAVVAPMGYGKTTAVNWFLNQRRQTEAAVILRVNIYSDNRFIFWKSVQNAFAAAGLTALAGCEYPEDASSAAQLMDDLCAVLAGDTPCYLFLDDFHLLKDEKAAKFLCGLANRLPVNIHLIVASRNNFLPKEEILRLGHRLHRIGREQLRLNHTELAHYAHRCGMDLTEAEVESLLRSCEGWFSAIYLNLHSLAERGILLSEDADIYSMFTAAMLENLPSQKREFLAIMGLADEFTVEMARVVTEMPDAEEILLTLTEQNAFVSRLPDGKTFRFHHMLKECAVRLFARLTPEKQDACRERYGAWYEAKQQYLHALTAYEACKDYDAALQVIERDAGILLSSLDPAELLERLGRCPVETLKRHPFAILVLMRCMFNWRQIPKMMELKQLLLTTVAEHPEWSQEEKGSLLGECDLILSFLMYNDISAMSRLHRSASAQMSRPAISIQSSGGWTFGSPSVLMMFHRAPGAMESELAEMDECMPHYYKVTNHHGQGAETIMRAEALFCQGRFTDAHIELERAYAQVKDNGQINMALCCDFLSRRLSLYTDVEQRYTFEERYAELLHYHDASWINLWSAASAYYHALRGETDKIPEIFSLHRLSDINMLAPGKPMMEMIENQVYLAQDAYAKVIGHSAQLLAVCEAMHYALVALHVRIQTAAAYEHLGKREEARAWLRQALSDAAPDGLVMPFVENYDFLKPLLARERKTDLIAKITELGEGAGARNAASARPAVFDALTPREFEIVELMAQRLSNREIAEKLYLSEGSVKQYVNQIYSKLHMEGDTRTKRKRLAELFGQKT